MNIKILDNSRVKYKGRYLTSDQVYNDIDDTTAQELINSGNAKQVDDKIFGVSFTDEGATAKTPKFDAKKQGYKAEAKLTDKQKRELEEKGAVETADGQTVEKDDTPVTGPNLEEDKVKDTTEIVGEDGNPLSEEELKAREAAASAGSPGDSLPTPQEANKTGEQV